MGAPGEPHHFQHTCRLRASPPHEPGDLDILMSRQVSVQGGGLDQGAQGVAAVSDAYLHGGRPETAWQVLQEALPQVDVPSLLRLQLGKVAAASGLHRADGLAALDQVLREPLEGGSSGYPGAWWRKGQILRDLGRKGEAGRAAQEALKLDPKHREARELLERMGHDR